MKEGDLTNFDNHVMDHAGHWETSILMYLYPECVDMDQIRDEVLSDEDWFNPANPGISGRDPRCGTANKELGKSDHVGLLRGTLFRISAELP